MTDASSPPSAAAPSPDDGPANVNGSAAAGNDSNYNEQVPIYPANYDAPNLISVAATDRTDVLRIGPLRSVFNTGRLAARLYEVPSIRRRYEECMAETGDEAICNERLRHCMSR